MKIFEKELPDINIYKNLNFHIQSDNFLFFDIETTGFTANNSMLYLIGCIAYENSKLIMRQWLCENFSDEEKVIKAFFCYTSNFDTLISFNGDLFDIRYLKNCCEKYYIDFALKNLKSFDMYKEFRYLKKLLNLDSLKQKSFENFLGIHRQDLYDGGELIQVYKDWLQDNDENKLNLLLLHNSCDLEGLVQLSFLLSYKDILKSNFTFSNFLQSKNFVTLNFKSDAKVPRPIKLYIGNSFLYINEDNLSLNLELLTGTLKHYFEDYYNYFYLPIEDSSIHKSLATFVEKTKRIKAKKDTAFIKIEDTFLQIFGDAKEKKFKTDFSSIYHYILLQNFNADNMATDILLEFLKSYTNTK